MKNLKLLILTLLIANTSIARVLHNVYVMQPPLVEGSSILPDWAQVLLTSPDAVTGESAGACYASSTSSGLSFGLLPPQYGGLGIDASSGSGAVLDTSGTISTGTLPSTMGGTDQSTYTLGDILYASASNVLGKLSGVTSTTLNVLTQIGTGSASNPPQWQPASSLGLMPTGAIVSWPFDIAPAGWFICDHSAVSRSTYANLFAVSSITTTGTNTLGSEVISGISSTTGMLPGYYVSGTGVPSATAIASVNSSTQITLTQSSTAAITSFVVARYGIGDGITTFNVPDTRGLFMRGSGTNASMVTANGGSVSGLTPGATQNDQVQGHSHTIAGISSAILNSGSYNAIQSSGSLNSSYTNNLIGSPTTDGTNGTPRTGNETRPFNMSINYIIKY